MKKRRKNKKSAISETHYFHCLAIIVFAAGAGLLIWFAYGYIPHGKTTDIEEHTLSGTVCEFRRVLDGICVKTAEEQYPDIIAVMIENHLAARPQSGLAQARVVYEAPVEANYTRFMALFDRNQKVTKAGPVRSARPYFLRWLTEWGSPMYMHVGGSPQALNDIGEYGIFNVNEFYRGWAYWRSDDRSAPHNAYTSHELWDSAWDKYKDETSVTATSSWLFDERNICEDDCVYEITASFLPPAYEAVWKFNTSTLQYERYQLGKPHIDQDGTPITADTIIVQHVQSKTIDEIGRKKIETSGQGDAAIFRDGIMTEGRWEKQDLNRRTMWLDTNGNPIPLKPGTVWIEVVPQDGSAEFIKNPNSSTDS